MNHYDFWNGIDYYGSFLGIQSRHKVNIIDDLEYLYDSDYFHDNLDKLFETEDINEELLEDDTRSNRKKLVLNNENIKLEAEELDTSVFKNVFDLTEENIEKHNMIELKLNLNKVKQSKTNSTCSSRSSNRNNEEEGEENTDNELEIVQIQICPIIKQ